MSTTAETRLEDERWEDEGGRVSDAVPNAEPTLDWQGFRKRFFRDTRPAPHGGDTQEVHIKTRPAVVAEIQHDATRREILLGDSRVARIEDGREERKIRLDPRGPRRRNRGLCLLRFGGMT